MNETGMNETANGSPADKNIYVEITYGWDGCDVVAALGKFDWKGAANAVRDWAKRHIGYKDYQDLSWSFSMRPGMVFVVDFGSHMYFARYRVEGGAE